jgi:hypothetical protein
MVIGAVPPAPEGTITAEPENGSADSKSTKKAKKTCDPRIKQANFIRGLKMAP